MKSVSRAAFVEAVTQAQTFLQDLLIQNLA